MFITNIIRKSDWERIKFYKKEKDFPFGEEKIKKISQGNLEVLKQSGKKKLRNLNLECKY